MYVNVVAQYTLSMLLLCVHSIFLYISCHIYVPYRHRMDRTEAANAGWYNNWLFLWFWLHSAGRAGISHKRLATSAAGHFSSWLPLHLLHLVSGQQCELYLIQCVKKVSSKIVHHNFNEKCLVILEVYYKCKALSSPVIENKMCTLSSVYVRCQSFLVNFSKV